MIVSPSNAFNNECERQSCVGDGSGDEIVFIAIVAKMEKKTADQFRVARSECCAPIVELSNWKTVISRVHSTRIPARHKTRIR